MLADHFAYSEAGNAPQSRENRMEAQGRTAGGVFLSVVVNLYEGGVPSFQEVGVLPEGPQHELKKQEPPAKVAAPGPAGIG